MSFGSDVMRRACSSVLWWRFGSRVCCYLLSGGCDAVRFRNQGCRCMLYFSNRMNKFDKIVPQHNTCILHQAPKVDRLWVCFAVVGSNRQYLDAWTAIT